mgnify:CR=1 FL=1
MRRRPLAAVLAALAVLVGLQAAAPAAASMARLVLAIDPYPRAPGATLVSSGDDWPGWNGAAGEDSGDMAAV